MSHERDAIARSFGRPFIEHAPTEPARQAGPKLSQPDRRKQPTTAHDLWERFRSVPDIVKAALVLPVLYTVLCAHYAADYWWVACAELVLAIVGVLVMLAIKVVLLSNKWLNDRLRG
jgi:hypothetical protein